MNDVTNEYLKLLNLFIVLDNIRVHKRPVTWWKDCVCTRSKTVCQILAQYSKTLCIYVLFSVFFVLVNNILSKLDIQWNIIYTCSTTLYISNQYTEYIPCSFMWMAVTKRIWNFFFNLISIVFLKLIVQKKTSQIKVKGV